MFETKCPRCQDGHSLARERLGELCDCQKCGWRFVALPPSADSVIEAREIVTALWPVRTRLKLADQRFVDSWMQAFVRRGADVRVGRYRLEYLRRTYHDNRHLLCEERRAA